MRQGAALGISLALGATLFYGQVPVLARLGFLNGIPAIESIVLRTYAVALAFGIAAAVRREPFGLTRAAWPSFLLQVAATLSVSACYLTSVQYIPVNLAVVIFFAFPVIILLFAPVIEGHAPDRMRIAVAVFAFAGIAVSIGLDYSSLNPLGLVLAALAAIGCAFQFFSGRILSRHMPPVVLSSLVHASVLPFIMALAWWLRHGEIAAFNGSATWLGVAAMTGVSLAYMGGYFLHMSSLSAAPASTVAPFFNLEPVVSTLMAGVVLREALAAHQIIGGAIVLAALILCGIIEKSPRGT
jgi:drug/metabolite transporter (DMT)-like permease